MKTFDPHCYDLAKLFTDDLNRKVTIGEINELASLIQTAIDDWMDGEDERIEERNQANYGDYIDSKLDEWRETGIRPHIMRYKGGR